MYDTTGAMKVTDEIVTAKKLVGPLRKQDVPILRCVGLNYAEHSTSLTPRPPKPPHSIFEAED